MPKLLSVTEEPKKVRRYMDFSRVGEQNLLGAQNLPGTPASAPRRPFPSSGRKKQEDTRKQKRFHRRSQPTKYGHSREVVSTHRMADEEPLSYAASLVSQGEHRFYTLTVPADVLARTCFVTTRDEDPEQGFQRVLSKARAQEIADYIDEGLGTIPTSVVLSAQPRAMFEYSARNKTVNFSDHKDSFLILDGQHRVYGFRLSNSELRVPVVIYNGLTKEEETRLFIDINTKQKPVPNELLLDIRKIANYQDDTETVLGQIFDLFDTRPGSPLLGNMSPRARKKNHISRVTFNAALKPLLPLFKEVSPMQIFETMSAYYSSVIKQIKRNSLDIPLTSPIPFRAITNVFPDVAQRVNDIHGKSYTVENFDFINSEIYNKVRPASLKNANGVMAYADALRTAMKPRSIF